MDSRRFTAPVEEIEGTVDSASGQVSSSCRNQRTSRAGAGPAPAFPMLSAEEIPPPPWTTCCRLRFLRPAATRNLPPGISVARCFPACSGLLARAGSHFGKPLPHAVFGLEFTSAILADCRGGKAISQRSLDTYGATSRARTSPSPSCALCRRGPPLHHGLVCRLRFLRPAGHKPRARWARLDIPIAGWLLAGSELLAKPCFPFREYRFPAPVFGFVSHSSKLYQKRRGKIISPRTIDTLE
jgi:hypothetical protein